MQLKSKKLRRRITSRRGAVAAIVAMLLIPLLLFTALSIDIGWIAKSKSELQNAADAAAAAGARQLIDSYASYSFASAAERVAILKQVEADSTSYALRYGLFNDAGGVQSLSIRERDIKFGFTDAQGNFDPTYSGYPNTVQVLARLDSKSNSPLRLFFGGITGQGNQPLTATASSTIYTGAISSFDPSGSVWGDDYGGSGDGAGCGLLPVAFDLNDWSRFIESGISPDGKTYFNLDGAQQIKVYPSPEVAPGNFGLLSIGNWTNSEQIYGNWILNGPSSSDIQFLIENNQLPVSPDCAGLFKGSPGLRSALRKDFEAIIGQPRLLPLFEPASIIPYQAASGAGSNTSYKIVGFVGVTVTSVSGQGSDLNISVSPCDVMDPAAILDPSSLYPAGAQPHGQLKTFTFAAPRFSK